MTKSELIDRLASRFPSLLHSDCNLATQSILDAITYALASGNRVEIRGFGSFMTRMRPPRIGRNPKTGDQVRVPEKVAPAFKAGAGMKEGVDLGRN